MPESGSQALRLAIDQLRTPCDPGSLGFETTAQAAGLGRVLGQERALAALRFGVGMAHGGYHLYALGTPGVGKHTVVHKALEAEAAARPTPVDWCYINNFSDPQRPIALQMPAGRAPALKGHMDQLVETLRTTIPAAFDSEVYRARVNEIDEAFKRQEEQAFTELQREAERQGMVVLHTPQGFAIAPVRDGQVLSPEQFNRLSEAERRRIEETTERLKGRLTRLLLQAPDRHKERRRQIEALNREIALSAIQAPVNELRERYADQPRVLAFLDQVQGDVLEHLIEFGEQGGASPNPLGLPVPAPPFFRRYRVNIMVDHAAAPGAPVVYEDNPSLHNLLGRVEYSSQFGTLITDFTHIRAGALHRANGGYLLLDVRRLLPQPYAWQALKRALAGGEIKIESLGQALGLMGTPSLEPQPIPLQVKVVLLGERLLYHLLCELDPDFEGLFRVPAEFEDDIKRGRESERLYAGLVADLIAAHGLAPFHREAVARVIEHGARLAGDAQKLSLHLGRITDLLAEADHWARQDGEALVRARHVQAAIDNKIHRMDRVRGRIQEAILRGTLLIDTEGEQAGQVNGLSVLRVGEFTFGQPSRITATVRLGKGEVIDIEREVELGGAIHSKGVLILSAFLGSRYAADHPLSLSASLVFEQTYGPVEGDSASVAELCALLSALAEVPIKQSLAVTGSVNQHGCVQAIGGVNEKIEGFFDVCSARGLSGAQGVVIPASNVAHLMLRDEVLEAVEAGRFHVWAVDRVDQVLELLTGLPAGAPDEHGAFPPHSVNARVRRRLLGFVESRRRYAAAAGEGPHERD